MGQDTLQMILRAAVRETATEVLQILLDADREAFLREHEGCKMATTLGGWRPALVQ